MLHTLLLHPMPHAILRVATSVKLMASMDHEWPSMVQNPDPNGCPSMVENPIPPAFQIVQHNYTNSELPRIVDMAIVKRIKTSKMQKLFELKQKGYESGDDDDDDNNHQQDKGKNKRKKNKKRKEVCDKWPNIKSINQIGIYSVYPKYPLGPLDDVHISLPTMLNWLEELGWRVLTMTNEYRTCDYLLVQ
jgi:hypothetical protein